MGTFVKHQRVGIETSHNECCSSLLQSKRTKTKNKTFHFHCDLATFYIAKHSGPPIQVMYHHWGIFLAKIEYYLVLSSSSIVNNSLFASNHVLCDPNSVLARVIIPQWTSPGASQGIKRFYVFAAKKDVNVIREQFQGCTEWQLLINKNFEFLLVIHLTLKANVLSIYQM